MSEGQQGDAQIRSAAANGAPTAAERRGKEHAASDRVRFDAGDTPRLAYYRDRAAPEMRIAPKTVEKGHVEGDLST